MKNFNLILIVIALFVFSGCGDKWESKATYDIADKENLIEWSNMINIRKAGINEKLASNDTRPSNVSPEVAITKMLQALATYEGDFSFPLNTVYTVKRVNDVIVNGHYYYVGLLEFDNKKSNGATIESLNGIISAIAVVDAEDSSKSAIIRTANAKNEPYEIKIHMESLTKGVKDSKQVFAFVDKNGFSNRLDKFHEVTAPKLEFDEDWNPYYSVTWTYDDSVAEVGTAYYPLAYGILDIQNETLEAYAMDNPITKDVDEGQNPSKITWKKFSEIPSWVDWVFSRRLFIQMATHNGFNIDNYGKYSVLGDLILDGSSVNDSMTPSAFADVIVDISLSRSRKDLIMMAYRTSRSNDMAMNSILTMNARTGEVVEHDSIAMTVKSTVVEVIEEAGLIRGEYYVQDLTLHTIFGKKTWQGIIVRDVTDNENKDNTNTGDSSELFYSESQLSYSVHVGTVWVEANNDISIDNIVFDRNYNLSKTKYRNHLYKKESRRGLSTVLVDTKLSAIVTNVRLFGNQVVFNLDNSKLVFVAEPTSAFDNELGGAISIKKGDYVTINYGNQKNSNIVPVRLIRVH